MAGIAGAVHIGRGIAQIERAVLEHSQTCPQTYRTLRRAWCSVDDERDAKWRWRYVDHWSWEPWFVDVTWDAAQSPSESDIANDKAQLGDGALLFEYAGCKECVDDEARQTLFLPAEMFMVRCFRELRQQTILAATQSTDNQDEREASARFFERQ